jgi:hypothetical protein
MITKNYWSENSIVNKIMLAFCNDMLINDFATENDDDYEEIYNMFSADINAIENWINSNDVEHIKIVFASEMHRFSTMSQYINDIVHIDVYTKFINSVPKTNYIAHNDEEIAYDNNVIALGAGSSVNIIVYKIA